VQGHSINTKISELELPVAPEDLTILTGAGVSVEGPTSLPSGEKLIERIFLELFQPEALSKILDAHDLVGWTSMEKGKVAPRLPRLETVLGIAKDVLGVRALGVLEDMVGAPPNRVHRFLNSHLAAGGHQVTANFDLCVESAISDGPDDLEDRIYHFHLKISRDGIPEDLGVTLDRIERGFSTNDKQRFISALTKSKFILVVGYSGSDFFDVDAAINELPTSYFTGTKVVWINHDDHALEVPDEIPVGAPRLVDALRRRGAEVTYAVGRTDEFLDLLISEWSFEPLSPSEPGFLKTITLGISGDDREYATFELYRRLGLFAELKKMLATSKLLAVPESDRWRAEMELLWAEGKYKQAWSRWRNEGKRMVSKPERLERLGACLWVQGRLVPAYFWLSWNLRRVDEDSKLLFVERVGRVVEKMWLTPELRPFARWATPGVLRRIPPPSQLDGVSTYRNVDDLVDSLENSTSNTRRTLDGSQISQEWFSQAGSVTAVVQFRHRELRDLDLPNAPPPREAFCRQIQLAKELGSPGDAARVVLIPGAGTRFNLKETLDIISQVEFGAWQRVRIVGLWIQCRLHGRNGLIPQN
jgi:hypothetical protein